MTKSQPPRFGFDAIAVIFERLPLDSAHLCEDKHRCRAKAEYVITIAGRDVKRVCRRGADIHARIQGFLNAEDACANNERKTA